MARSITTDSTQQRPLRLRAREDLEFFPRSEGKQACWVVKDPVSLRYFHLREEEYSILRWLDGRASLADVVARFCRKFAPRRITEVGLQGFLGRLHESGLILSDRPGQAESLLRRRREQRNREVRAAFSSVLAIRLPGMDPQAMLRRVYPLVGWMFGPGWLVASAAIMLLALLTVSIHADTLASRLPEMQAFFGPVNLIRLVLCLAVVKVLHELGHAMACRHYGCDCHEIGVLLLVFTPCLYCDVTDSWTLPDKRQRMAISAAGIYVELLLASVAAIVWRFAPDGLVGALALNVLFLCSVNTLFLNGNPLLRYDGYYLLADGLGIPNLWQRSRAVLSGLVQWAFLGQSRSGGLPEERPVLLGIYGLMSIVYRWIVVFAILSFLYRILRPMGLETVTHGITVITLLSMVYGPVKSLGQRVAVPSQRRLTAGRFFPWALVGCLAAVVCFVPLPCRVRAPAVLEPAQVQHVYVTAPGRLIECRREGESVRAGETIAVLENDELVWEIETLSTQVDEQAAHVRSLEARRGGDVEAAAELPTARQSLEALRSQLAARRIEAEALIRKAPQAGRILPAPTRETSPVNRLELTAWQGLPTEASNVGAFLETGTLLCSLGDDSALQAVVYLNENDVQQVRPGDPVKIMLEQSRPSIVEGTVLRIDASKLENVPRRLASLGVIPNVPDGEVARPLETYYRAEIEVARDDLPLVIGMRGRAKISVAPISLAGRAWRVLGRTFRRAR